MFICDQISYILELFNGTYKLYFIIGNIKRALVQKIFLETFYKRKEKKKEKATEIVLWPFLFPMKVVLKFF